jgi:N-acetylmuramoyl-L-alanine amidase
MSSDAGSIPAASKILLGDREKLYRYKRGIPRFTSVFFFLILYLSFWGFSQNQSTVSVSAKDYPDYSRVIIASSSPLSTSIEKSESFLFVKIRANTPFRFRRESFQSRFVKSLEWTQGRGFYTLTIATQDDKFFFDSFKVSNPPQLIIDIHPNGKEEEIERTPETTDKVLTGRSVEPLDAEARSARIGSLSLDPECIVIDPGHGGLEAGAKGKFGTLEKDLTLAISMRLAEIIRQRRASNIVLTRDRDVDVTLEDRAAIANNNKATIFISVHVNSSYRKGAAGPETFFLSKDATDEEARRLAFLENNSENLDNSIESDNQDVIKMILWDMAQTAYLKQSSELAESIQTELNFLWGTSNRGIKQAPFKVLTGVACPAVLIEVAFLSNPQEERKLLTDEYQNKVAEAIYKGMTNFLRENSRL